MFFQVHNEEAREKSHCRNVINTYVYICMRVYVCVPSIYMYVCMYVSFKDGNREERSSISR